MFDVIKFSGYKSFPIENTCEITDIKYLNLFIGKNNCGKSSVLDVIGAACSANKYHEMKKYINSLIIGYDINDDALKNSFLNPNPYYQSEYNSATQYIGKKYWVSAALNSMRISNTWSFKYAYDKSLNNDIENKNVSWSKYIDHLPKNNFSFKTISAERNIVPENHSVPAGLKADGTGATNFIRKIIYEESYDESLIENKLLTALNTIMGSDAQFESIRVQERPMDEDNEQIKCEVYLQEKNNNRFPLSKTGSGLKTIILVLLNLLILPEINKNTAYVFGFEELENNLHPALQRRLFDYIYNYAVENKRYIFITTHSHVAINMFFDKEEVSIYHVVKENQISSVKKIDNYMDKVEILDDLDIKASDLLQSNGVIWVEGPSDRIYIKKWLELFGGTEVEEGKDFQFAYYGGRVLSHYTAELTLAEEKDLLNVLLINRNSAIVMDSDKTSQQKSINDTKKRVLNEFDSKGLFSWITKGKEIENYLSLSSIKAAFENAPIVQCGKYEQFPDYISHYYKNFSHNKIPFANKVKEYITNENVLDLEEKIKELYDTIKSWNK